MSIYQYQWNKKIYLYTKAGGFVKRTELLAVFKCFGA